MKYWYLTKNDMAQAFEVTGTVHIRGGCCWKYEQGNPQAETELALDRKMLLSIGYTDESPKPKPVKLNLYLLTQGDNNDYDTYDSMVVCAPDEYTAVRIHPVTVWDSEKRDHIPLEYREDEGWFNSLEICNKDWANAHATVNCTLIGSASEGTEQGVVVASFNAG